MKYIYQTILVTVFAFLSSTGIFAHSFEANGIYYKITSYNSTYPTVEVTYKGTYFDSYREYSGSVYIPSYVSYNGKGYYVTSIGSEAFRDCTGLTNVSIPNSVTSIGSAAFNYCKSLTSITIPNSVTTIGDYAFWSCYGLTSVTIPNGLVNIKHHAFYECNNLSFISIPESVIFIEQSAFEGTAWYNNQPNGLVYAGKVLYKYKGELEKGTEIVIKDGTKGIANNTFRDCNNLTSIIIPESVTSIGRDAFAGTAWYNNQPDGMVYAGKVLYKYKGDLVGESNITIKDGTTGIGDEAFYRYSAIESIDIPNSVLTIGNSAFEGCGSLKSITIPSSVTTIGNRAFCEIQFESVTIGSGVLSVGNHAFGKYPYGENKPTKIIWLTNTPPSGYINAEGKINYVANEQYVSFDNKVIYPFLSSIFEAGGIKYVPVNPSDRTCDAIDCSYDNLTTSLKIGKSVSYMGIDMVVKKLQPYICYQNTNIKDVVLEHEGEVPQYAFKGCTGLENIIISNDGNISQYAFKGCTRLENITISNNGDISQYAFDECTGLKTINLQNKGFVGDATFQGCTLLEKVTFGKNISGVGRYAFKGCSSLLSIDLPDNVQSIGANAFSNCSSISKAKIGAGIQSLEANIFSDCQLLSEVTIGKNVKNIGPNAFNGCTSLSCITIPQSVNSIESYALRGCTQLKTIIFEEGDNELSLNNNVFTDDPLDSVYIGRNLSYSAYSSDGYSPFYRISTLRSIHISDKETEISNYEFYGCTNLQNVQIGDGVISIGDWAFSGCSSLEYFAFGSSVKTIGKEAFSDCIALTDIVSHTIVPPVCGTQALDDINKWTCKLIVPQGYVPVYQTADQWKDFFFIEEGEAPEIPPTAISLNKSMTKLLIGENETLIAVITPDEATQRELKWKSSDESVAEVDENGVVTAKKEGTATITVQSVHAPMITASCEVTVLSPNIIFADATVKAICVTNWDTNGDGELRETEAAAVTDIGRVFAYTDIYSFDELKYFTGLTNIESAFSGCSSLTSITIPNSVTSIGTWAFNDCNELTSIKIPNSVTSIGKYAFCNCSGLTSITIPNSVMSIGEHAFTECI